MLCHVGINSPHSTLYLLILRAGFSGCVLILADISDNILDVEKEDIHVLLTLAVKRNPNSNINTFILTHTGQPTASLA